MGERLIAGDDAGHVLFYQLGDLENPVRLEAAAFGIQAIAYDAKNEWLATASTRELTIWQGNPPEVIRTIQLRTTNYIILTFNNDKLVMGTPSSIQIIDPTGEQSTEVIGDLDTVRTSFLVYEDWLFEGNWNGTLRVSENSESVGLWRGHSNPILSLAIVPERNWLVSGDESGLLLIREIETRATVIENDDHEGAILSLSVNEEKMLLASLDDTGRIIIWDLE